jgi:hypothetical protein
VRRGSSREVAVEALGMPPGNGETQTRTTTTRCVPLEEAIEQAG